MPLFALLASCTDRLRVDGSRVILNLSHANAELPVTGGGPTALDQPLASQLPQQQPVAISNTGHLGPATLVRMDGQIYQKEGDKFTLLRPLASTVTPEQKAMLSRGASEQAGTKRVSQDKAKPAPGPTKSPVPKVTTRIVPKEEEAELMKTLVGKPQPLRLRYDSGLQAGGKKWDEDLLEQEKREERHRNAWAKLGKEPPPPKASKSSSKADRLDSLPANASKSLAAANASGSIKRPLPTYSPASSNPAQPAGSKSGNSKEPPAQPSAAPAPHATRGLPSAVSNMAAQKCQHRSSQAKANDVPAGSGAEEDDDEDVTSGSDSVVDEAEHAANMASQRLEARHAESLRRQQAEAEAQANASALLR